MINARVDHQIGDKDRLVGRVYSDHINLTPQYNPKNIQGYSLGFDIPAVNYMVQETHIFRAIFLNQASFVYSSVPSPKCRPRFAEYGDFGVKGSGSRLRPLSNLFREQLFQHLRRRGGAVQRQQF